MQLWPLWSNWEEEMGRYELEKWDAHFVANTH